MIEDFKLAEEKHGGSYGKAQCFSEAIAINL